jgi:hypothetical protein
MHIDVTPRRLRLGATCNFRAQPPVYSALFAFFSDVFLGSYESK